MFLSVQITAYSHRGRGRNSRGIPEYLPYLSIPRWRRSDPHDSVRTVSTVTRPPSPLQITLLWDAPLEGCNWGPFREGERERALCWKTLVFYEVQSGVLFSSPLLPTVWNSELKEKYVQYMECYDLRSVSAIDQASLLAAKGCAGRQSCQVLYCVVGFSCMKTDEWNSVYSWFLYVLQGIQNMTFFIHVPLWNAYCTHKHPNPNKSFC